MLKPPQYPRSGDPVSGSASIITNVKFFDAWGLRIGPNASARLADETDPNGDVVIYDRYDIPRLVMPVSVWHDLQTWLEDHPVGQIHVGPPISV